MVRDLFQLNTLCKKLFVGAFVVLIGFAAAYGFFLKRTVAAVVERRSIESDRSELAARVSVLEARYIEAADAVTLEHARSLGFVDASSHVRFVARASAPTLSFDYRAHE